MKARISFTDEQLQAMKSSELLKFKLSDDEISRLRAINNRKEIERLARETRIKTEEKKLLEELRRVEINISSVWDLVNASYSYKKAIPILIKHLSLGYSDVVKEGIARSLAVPDDEVRAAWCLIVDEFRKAPIGNGIVALGDTQGYRLGAKDGLACTLSAVVTNETLPELIALAKDGTLGASRILLLSALKKRRNKNLLVKQAIEELAKDPELKREIASWGT